LVPLAFIIAGALAIAFGVVKNRRPSSWGPAVELERNQDRGADAQKEHDRELIQKTVVKMPEARSRSIGSATPFEVPLRKDDLEMYPCSDCHEDEEPNLEIRELEYEHDDLIFDHGGGRLWCHNCHDPTEPGTLSSLKEEAIDLDAAYLLCGECHFRQQTDWYFGAHGKRIGLWTGRRRIYSCPECHDPHSPSIKPFVPEPPPLPRKGLTREILSHESHEKVWERLAREQESP
jgi:hypothetical protein